MEKYLLTNWKTVPFKRKSFEGQMDRYVKVCVTSINKPQKVLFILPLYGTTDGYGFHHIIKNVYNHELGQDNKSDFPFSDLLKPFYGKFIEIPSMHGILFRKFTKDEAEYGICSEWEVSKVERDSTGKVKMYDSIKVFSLYEKDDITGEMAITSGWHPYGFYYRFFGYNYYPLSDLTEPLQL